MALFGNQGQTDKKTAIGTGAVTGAGAGAAFGPIGAGIGAVLGAGLAFAQTRKRSKFRAPQVQTVNSLVQQLLSSNVQERIIQSQLGAQRAAFPQFFAQQQKAIQAGESLASRLTGPGATDFISEQIRSEQAGRGVALSPASALQGGLRIGQARLGFEQQAFGVRSQLTQLAGATPLGIESSFSGLLNLAGQQAGQQLNVDLQARSFRNQQTEARRAATGAALARISTGFGGAAFAPEGQRLQGFFQGAGLAPLVQRQQQPGLSNVNTTQGGTRGVNFQQNDPFVNPFAGQ